MPVFFWHLLVPIAMASKCSLFIVIPRCTKREVELLSRDQTGQLPVKRNTTSASKGKICCGANLNLKCYLSNPTLSARDTIAKIETVVKKFASIAENLYFFLMSCQWLCSVIKCKRSFKYFDSMAVHFSFYPTWDLWLFRRK
jgi:hypothetical protein